MVHSGDGSDIVYAGVGDDVVGGGNGDDYPCGGSDADQLHGGSGNDRIAGNRGDDLVYGGPGNDILFGGWGADRLFGGSGNDVLHALAPDGQADLLDCGPGRDKAYVLRSERPLSELRGCETVYVVYVVDTLTPDQNQGENADTDAQADG